MASTLSAKSDYFRLDDDLTAEEIAIRDKVRAHGSDSVSLETSARRDGDSPDRHPPLPDPSLKDITHG